MPFVTPAHRREPDSSIPGDRCYMQYVGMMELWRENPRWTTVDEIASWIWPEQESRAMLLAFLVFFCLWVIPYERQKRRENGDI